MLPRTTRAAACAALIALAAAAAAAPAPAAASTSPRHRPAAPGADCQPYARRACLFPFPSNLFTRADPTTATGLRVQLPGGALPVSSTGTHIDPRPYDRNDGFSPGSTLIVHVRGLDNPRALRRTGAAGLLDMSRSDGRNQPVVVIDEHTGRRQLIWSELDPAGAPPQDTDLVIHPGGSFTEGHTYVVALRNLKTDTGRTIPAPSWFERMRDDRRLTPAQATQRARYRTIFAALRRARIPRRTLYEAWDFTVGSTASLTGRLLTIRNDAFAQLGDRDLADGVVRGRPPRHTITGTAPLALGARAVFGTLQVPCYLVHCGPSATGGFHYSSRSPNALPTQRRGSVATTAFECVIPPQAGRPRPARISLYGHGFLSNRTNVQGLNILQLATAHDIVLCATDWWGLAEGDKWNDIRAMLDLDRFPAIVDRMQQGVLNMLYLGRLMANRRGLAADPAFRVHGRPAIDTSHLFYDGNSTGGIQGSITTAVSPDVRRAAFGVTGIDWANWLIPRTAGIGSLGRELYSRYPDRSIRPALLDLMQQLWDRGDPDGYAQRMTTHPLPDTPAHTVLMQIAYGDHQVPMYAGAAEARTAGVQAYQPALDLSTDRARDRNLFDGLTAIRSFPYSGSAIEIWDAGPGAVSPPPVDAIPYPSTTPPPNFDPHEVVSYTPAAQDQISDFLKPGGAVVDVCDGRPCRAIGYQP